MTDGREQTQKPDSPQTGAHSVYGPFRERWKSLGWEKSYLGYPISEVGNLVGQDGVFGQDFQGGRILYNENDGTVNDYKR
ncbi:LGFP repeat-containing protein [Actinopolyspora mortivallis]|uniref:LGFP repeat-containing protein n=1 Tax=Actinopolyspora mortivallis TaxID=33906 RepID=UPI0015E5E589|nr:hypothetical protein [Actinopolyspora mortivallis]